MFYIRDTFYKEVSDKGFIPVTSHLNFRKLNKKCVQQHYLHLLYE